MGINPNDPTFSASQIVGQTLIAKAKVITYDEPYDNANQVGSYDPGQTVGIVTSWEDANPALGRARLYWQFSDNYGNFYYAPHFIGEFDVQSLVDSGALTAGAQTQAQIDANKSLTDKLLGTVQQWLPWVVGGMIGIALIGTLLKNRKSSN